MKSSGVEMGVGVVEASETSALLSKISKVECFCRVIGSISPDRLDSGSVFGCWQGLLLLSVLAKGM